MASSQSTITSSMDLPIDIAIDILSRLPVKSLLRFKSVCKTWYALIKSHNFISKHLTQSSLNPNLNIISLLVTSYPRKPHDSFPLFYLNGSSDDPTSLDFPFWTNWKFYRIVGSSNGLLCVQSYKKKYPVILCNPATRKFRPILNYRSLDFRVGPTSSIFLGFGFHVSANDYKLLRIVTYNCPTTWKYLLRTDIYTMGTDNWREIEFKFSANEVDHDVVFKMRGSSVLGFVNGVFYWEAYILLNSELILLSFDMGDEVFQIIRTPHCMNGIRIVGADPLTRFTQLKDKLSLIDYVDNRFIDVWVLNDKERTWTNQFRIGCFPRFENHVRRGEIWRIKLVGCAKNGDLIVHESLGNRGAADGKLYLYDLKNQEIKNLLAFDDVHFPYQIRLYTESLVPI